MSADRKGAWVERAGLALFLAGLLGFVLAGTLGVYRLDGAALDRLVDEGRVRDVHARALDPALAGQYGIEHATPFSFLTGVDRAITTANQALDPKDTIWDYDRGQIRLALAREAAHGFAADHPLPLLWLTVGLAALGGLLYALPRFAAGPGGIRNDGVRTSRVRSRGWIGIAFAACLIGFYVLLYFYPAYIVNWIGLTDPLSLALRGTAADRWFFYGTLYTLVILVMGVRMLAQYRHSRYQIVRTLSVMFFQLGFAFLIPAILASLNRPQYDFKNAWPLDYSFFYSYRLDAYTAGGGFGWFVLLWGIGLAFLLIPLLAFFFGKRWYCSWVCGCGGLAETLGDPFRHLSNNGLRAWKVERYLVHGVLVFAVAMTAIVLVNYFSSGGGEPLLGQATGRVQSWYGFLIGSIFAGVVGTGFYPFMGNRVWCRFGCPLAAILGLVQRYASRFRITTNGGQCISCGNCSTYCEMGIDVRHYAQRGQNVIRSSCVGCGICAEVCPRGVLRLENGPPHTRHDTTSLLHPGHVG